MQKSIAVAFLAGAALLFAGSAGAQSVVDIKGVWKGDAQNIVDGPANHHPPSGTGIRPAAKYLLSDQTFTMTIDGQDGRRFWGTMASSRKTERLIGSFSVD